MDKSLILALLKSLVMLLFFLIVVGVGTLPIRSKTFKQKPLIQAIGSTFAGALFINVAIMHILPESADALEQHMKGGSDKEVFPLAYLLLMVGFLITVFFTKVFGHHSHDAVDSHLSIQDALLNEQKQQNPEKQIHSNKEAYILTIAIYFHTIFEGIAVGVQANITGFLSTAVAIGFHKWADALSMGCHYRTKNVQKKISYALIIGQAILNVLSIGVGWLIASQGEVLEAIFLSISAGTFLAISTLQLLGQQLEIRKYIVQKYLLMLGATGFVAAIWFFENSIFEDT